MNIFVSSYNKDKSIAYYKSDYNNQLEMVYKEDLPNFPSYMKRFKNNLFIALKKDENSSELGILEYIIFQNKLKRVNLYKSDYSFTHLYVDEKYIIGASYHQGLIQIWDKKSNRAFIKVYNNSKIHNVGYINRIRKFYAVDLSNNCIYFFRIKKQMVIDEDCVRLSEDDSPRHIWYSSDNRYIYLVTENSSKIKVIDLDNGYNIIQEISTIKDYSQKNEPAAIMADESGEFLYISNRGKDNISVFKINKKNGLLTYKYSIDDIGKTPRDFYIKDNIIYVASQESDRLSVFRLDSKNKLYDMIQSLKVDNPVCIKV